MVRVLLIDDNPLDRKIARDALAHAGFKVEEAPDGAAGLRALYAFRPDVVVLDVLMPEVDGWTVCLRVRELSDVPILMLTSLNREQEMVRGLELGADDFVAKPVSPGHLVARVHALLRRSQRPAEARPERLYDDGLLSIDLGAHQVRLAGAPVELTPTEFRLLAALARAPNRVQPYRDLLAAAWGPEYVDDLDFLRVYIWRLRKKLEPDPESPRWIRTERGFGYRFATAPTMPAGSGASALSPGAAAGEIPSSRAAPPDTLPSGGKADRAAKSVLIVEDDPVSLKLMRDVLRASGYATEDATNGADALARARRSVPDLIVMDIGLPDLDGVELTRRMKRGAATKGIPIIVVTAYAMPSEEARIRAAGCDAYLSKPLRHADLVTLVERLLQRDREPGG